MELIKVDDLVRVARLEKLGGKNTARILMSLLQFDKINQLYARHQDKDSTAFVHGVLNDAGIKYNMAYPGLARIPKEGGFIIIANHPYGGAEGLILLDALSKRRPDVKMMANFLFNWIDPLKDRFFGVNPFETHKYAQSSFHGLKKAFNHVQSGHPLVIFPAGEVSTYQERQRTITDRPWSNSILRFIKNNEVPVIPVYFGGNNSMLFHWMGRVHPLLRTAKIPSELLNKQNETIQVHIGNPILVKEQNGFTDMDKFGRFLRAKTYILGTNLEPGTIVGNNRIQTGVPISDAINTEILAREIISITPHYQLFQWQNYVVYFAPSILIPKITAEIGRLREITFREVGEGTLQNTDIDRFDAYYHQLFIWDCDRQSIVGGYRIGKGDEIVHKFGLKGFYTQTLFRMDRNLVPFMSESIELGRSFIVKEYQRKPMPLFLLWKGILSVLQKNNHYKYLVGPVSISNRYTLASRELMVGYINKYHVDHLTAMNVKPRRPFVAHPALVDTDILLDNITNLSQLDQAVSWLEPHPYKMPVLLRKYLELGGKIAAFNVDQLFNNTVDGFLILEVSQVKPEMIQALSKSQTDKEKILST